MLKDWTTVEYVKWWEYWISKVPQNLAPAENLVRNQTPLRNRSEWPSNSFTVNRHAKSHKNALDRRRLGDQVIVKIGAQIDAADITGAGRWTGGWED